MNLFSFIVLLALFLEFGLELVANLFNLKALKLEPPPALQGIYDAGQYRRSQEYTRVATRFHIITSAFNLLALLIFWFAGGFNALDVLVRSWGLSAVVTGLLYIGILSAAYTVITLPFSIYATFVIEGRFGFNRTTPRTFIMDRIKGLVLAVALGGGLLAGVLALFQYAGLNAWLYCWAAVTVVSLGMQYVAPTWIMPLFNRFTPMETGPLREAIMDYASAVKFPIKNVFVMDGSRRSSRSNAFFTGIGRNKRIALFDTLITRHTVAEIVAVLAHEIGHYKHKHVLVGTLIGIAHTGVLFFLLSIFLGSPGLYRAFFVAQPSVYTGLLFFGLLYTPIEMVLGIGMQIVSRRNEYQADRFAASTIKDPRSMVEALKKLSVYNLSNLTPHPFFVFLNYSHPPLLQRIEAVEQAVTEQEKGQ